MLDSDLAKLYECANGTKDINKAVKRNSERFPEDFYFQLKESEFNNLRFQNGTSKSGAGGRTYLPYVFTEQGVSMLASVLKTEKAAITSVSIMRAFVEMKNYLINNIDVLEQRHINSLVFEHNEKIEILEEYLPTFKTFSNQIFYDGQIYDAYSLLLDIFSESKDNIIIIDNYISKELLDILCKINVDIIIYTKNISNTLLNKYNSQYSNITVKIDNRFHDRFIIIDNKILYHCGASFKDLGKKCFCISKIEDSSILSELIKKL